jgi:uncharacterized ferritin-like protein (DUF455 family)
MIDVETGLFELVNFVESIRAQVKTVPPNLVPPKSGLQSPAGQARLLHDLANIELQAVELGLRTLREFKNSAPREFLHALSAITLEEGEHLKLCLYGINDLGFKWGQWPVHTQLCDTVSANDTLLERIFIVHCYLEGSGLDAGEILLRRLSGVKDPRVLKIVERIVRDELKHVSFGVKWFRQVAATIGLNADTAMLDMLGCLRTQGRLPARGAVLARAVRQHAGFNEQEINLLELNQSRINAAQL